MLMFADERIGVPFSFFIPTTTATLTAINSYMAFAMTFGATADSNTKFGVNADSNTTTLQVSSANGTACQGIPAINLQANALALYNQLPEGAFTADHLLKAGSVKTALSYLEGNEETAWELRFYEGPDRKVCTDSGALKNVCIIFSIQACDGLMHVIDTFLAPPSQNFDFSDYVGSEKLMYDIPLKDLEVPLQISVKNPQLQCSQTLLQAIEQDSELVVGAGVLKAFDNLGLIQTLNRSDIAVTIFLGSTSSIDGFRKFGFWFYLTLISFLDVWVYPVLCIRVYPFISTWSAIVYAEADGYASPNFDESWKSLAIAIGSSLLAYPYCLRDLLQLRSIESVYSSSTNYSYPLRFESVDDKVRPRALATLLIKL
jgi:hypothetical protein